MNKSTILIPETLPSTPVFHLGAMISFKSSGDAMLASCVIGEQEHVFTDRHWIGALAQAQTAIENHFNQISFVFYDEEKRDFAGSQKCPYMSDLAFSDVNERIERFFDRGDGLECYFRSQITVLSAEDLMSLLLQDDFLLEVANELLPGTFIQKREPTVCFEKIGLIPVYSCETLTIDDMKMQITRAVQALENASEKMANLLTRLDVMADYRPSAYPGLFWRFSLL